MSTVKKTVVLADDHPLLLRGIQDIFLSCSEFTIVAACADGANVMVELRQKLPDLAVIDVDMPLLNGLGVLRQIRAHALRTRVILLTSSITDAQIFEAIGLGVYGLMLKDSAADQLLESLRTVAAGRRWLPREMIDAAMARESERRFVGRRILSELSPREVEIMRIVAEGQPNKLIARRLGLTEGTVKIHLHNIYQKLDVANRTALACLASNHRDLLFPH
ncbi:LuxR C-terminal-related transcriptional regulator [Mesorhizobium sp. 10J20-29]